MGRFLCSSTGLCEANQQHVVSTQYSAMRSKVVRVVDGSIRFPMMESAAGKQRSQIENFIVAHYGPGVHT
jgi:4-hydroxyphenylpyruvate dioxygenase-like putative hemolysin